MSLLKSRASIALILLLVLASCGGGSGDGGGAASGPGSGGSGGAPVAPTALSYQSPIVATAGQAVAPMSPTVTGSVTSYAVTPALPAGLSLNATTGLISGTPSAAQGRTDYTLTATNTAGSTSFIVTITVNPAAPVGLSYTSPVIAIIGQAMQPLSPTVTGSVSTYSISPALPPGLNMNASSGVISGTPTSAGQQSHTVTASNVTGSTSFVVTITVNPPAPFSLSYTSPVIAIIGQAMQPLSPTVTGAVSTYSISPALPPGLNMNASSGVISGTPTSVSQQSYTVTATNVSGSVSFVVSITVNPAAPAGLSYTSPVTVVVGQAMQPLSPTVTGTVSTYSISPALPPGLNMNASSGVISGTPTTVAAQQAHTITASNVTGSTSFVVTITVNPRAPVDLSYSSPVTVVVGQAMQPLSPTVTGTVSTYSISPALPPGLHMDTSSGIIEGIPTSVTAQQTYTITAANDAGDTSFVVTITVNPAAPVDLSYASPVTVVIGQAMQPLSPTVTGTVTTYSISPALPPGLNMNTSSGVIGGTPTSVTAQQTYAITASNVTGIATFDLELRAVALQTADAGADQTVELGSFVSLDGSASFAVSGDPLIFHWAFTSIPDGSEAAMAATSSTLPMFRADRLGTYIASLTVSDNAGTSAPATVTVTVVPKVARVVPPPPSNSTPIASCREIVAPGNYVLQTDLVASVQSGYCLSIHDTSNVVLYCNGWHIYDAADLSSYAIEIRNVQGFTVQNCVVTTDSWDITNASDGHILDNRVNGYPGLVNSAGIWVTRSPRLRFEHNEVSDIALHLADSDDSVVSENVFATLPGHAARAGNHVRVFLGTNIQIFRNEFDGGWDGVMLYPNLQNTLETAVTLKDATNAVVRHNYMKNYWAAGVMWVGRLEGSVIQENVIVNTGYTAIGGWAWGSVSDTRFVQNLADRTTDLFHAYRLYGLRPANFEGSDGPIAADAGVYFRNNLFDGNVLQNQGTRTYFGTEPSYSSSLPLFDRMRYSGGLSPIPGEVVPTAAQFDMSNNTFIRNDFGRLYPGPFFGANPAVAGEVIDGGQNLCVSPGAGFPLACN